MKRVPLFVIILLLFTGHSAAQEGLSKFQKVLVQTEGEDATSFFEYIYFYDKHDELVRTINIWNGGCCQAPLIEEHRFDGDRFKHMRSYTIDEKPESFARHLLCTADLKTTLLEPSDAAVAGYSVKEVESVFAVEDSALFAGCTQN